MFYLLKKSLKKQHKFKYGKVNLEKKTNKDKLFEIFLKMCKDTSILPEHKLWKDYLFNITRDGYPAILSSPWYINFISYGYTGEIKF